MTTWLYLLTVAIGGAFGSVARYLIKAVANSFPTRSVALETTVANVLGCTAIGAWGKYWFFPETAPHQWVPANRVGFFCSLTTFSTFVSDSIGLATSDRLAGATGYMLANLVIGFAALLLAASLVSAGMR